MEELKQNGPLSEEFRIKAENKFDEYLSEFDEGPLMDEGLQYLWEQGKKNNVKKDTHKSDK
ncbi:hypothetical protein Syn7803C102_165 [Synechococcus phage ACG-2014d]|jgi:hypothetical protein|uniref:Uncharacterized protein n=1 Tax=Synechococcus phage ACG-2014d TaxID=1493509 RepID=A0A0E3HZ88_9CAUD|nr:hypothetical protein AAJ59_gp165 [Synechococcus phage ACG-2014d]YP_010355336.1 hypothetical protein M1M12_gp167 [Synechococcus phage ACG-2014d]AIX14778.1 hypothetical protein Syn7803C45_167 [Synechococcus phage ACG-2014d]AIX14996.1 hypothetical protein Syn7803C46_165 [Synechococcus phage ACG-2014d]AIX15423.1 hypothetical protein Syn7803C48_165 [Synechococcus phage ACG-2014d]AIX15643.1 hypothetical protein Syn7803C49_167 [Synechococcus phage ACG-2014d]AIX16071.1 hypothetical protein Syn7803